jgi:hypothetical protein
MRKHLTVDDLIVRHIRQQEFCVQRMNELSSKHNINIYQQVVVMDLKHVSYSINFEAMQTLRKTIIIDEAFYPERLHALYMINAPMFFTAIWAVIKPWLNPVTASKFHIIGTHYIDKLREHISDENIPAEYGGKYSDFSWQMPYNYQPPKKE